MSSVVAFYYLLFSHPGAANRHVGRGSGGDSPSPGSRGQRSCLLDDGQEQQALLGPPCDSRQRCPHAFSSCACGDDPNGLPLHRAATGRGGGHVLHSPKGCFGHSCRLALAG
jgi:hypothetical protein